MKAQQGAPLSGRLSAEDQSLLSNLEQELEAVRRENLRLTTQQNEVSPCHEGSAVLGD